MKHILITCDTEVGELAGNKEDAFEVFIEGKVDGEVVGVELINKIADEYGAKVMHFIDIYPYEKYGEEKFKNLCLNILKSGHFIGLHTHPSGKYDKNRKFMWQYSLEEQKEIIKFGKKKLKEWTGIDVIWRRAGGYGANDDTLIALKNNGLLIDSSFFYRNENCNIGYLYINKPSFYNGIFQIPVTVYKKNINYYPFYIKRSNIVKLDFRYGAEVEEIVEVVENMPEESIAVLFLHSFNFLNLPYNFKTKKYGKISVNYDLINRFKQLLSLLRKIDSVSFVKPNDIDLGKKYDDFLIEINARKFIGNVIISKIKKSFGKRGNI